MTSQIPAEHSEQFCLSFLMLLSFCRMCHFAAVNYFTWVWLGNILVSACRSQGGEN